MGTGGLDIWVLAGTSRQEYNFLCAIFWILGDVCGKIDADVPRPYCDDAKRILRRHIIFGFAACTCESFKSKLYAMHGVILWPLRVLE